MTLNRAGARTHLQQLSDEVPSINREMGREGEFAVDDLLVRVCHIIIVEGGIPS